MSDNTWICQLSLEMCRQLPCYNGRPQEKVPGWGGGGEGRKPQENVRKKGEGAPGEGVVGEESQGKI